MSLLNRAQSRYTYPGRCAKGREGVGMHRSEARQRARVCGCTLSLSCSLALLTLLTYPALCARDGRKNGEFPFDWRPPQFPVRVCFAMTINNFQGQTLERAGIYVAQDVFAHGHLFTLCYVACLSPIQTTHILFALQRFPPCTWMYNIVYKQVID